MKHSRGNLIATIIPIFVLVFVAASGWYFYNSRVNGLLETESVIRAQLISEKNSQEELAALLEKTVAEKMGIENTLQQEAKEAILITLGLESELENLQITITELVANESLLQAELILETNSKDELAALLEKTLAEKMGIETTLQQEAKETILNTIGMESELENLQITITELLANERVLQAELISEKESKEELVALLEKTLAEKMDIETTLWQETEKAMLTTSGLESELEKRQTEQNSLYEEITAVSGEKSQLLIQLEQEQKSKQRIANLKNRLEQELNESRVEISQLKNRLTVIKLTSEVLFSSGSAQIKPTGQKVLSIIAESLNAYPDRAISVEGHTDNRPMVQNARYKSNWELSIARGLAAVKYFQANNQVDPKRLKVIGYGEYRPVSSNETAEGRKLNRRIEIRILPPDNTDLSQN
jgi:chemotaxis protein MotB